MLVQRNVEYMLNTVEEMYIKLDGPGASTYNVLIVIEATFQLLSSGDILHILVWGLTLQNIKSEVISNETVCGHIKCFSLGPTARGIAAWISNEMIWWHINDMLYDAQLRALPHELNIKWNGLVTYHAQLRALPRESSSSGDDHLQ